MSSFFCTALPQHRLKFLSCCADILRVNINSNRVRSQGNTREVKAMRYVARQPIVDLQEKVCGYELLFRDGIENAFHGDSEVASRATLDNSLLMGLDVLCDGKLAFVNCTRDTLIKGLVRLLPPKSTVVEVLETVPADPDVVGACLRLKEAGYKLALDDYGAEDPREPLLEIADIIKVEMGFNSDNRRNALLRKLRSLRGKILAEKVESYADFDRARDEGFAYFQGYFFRRPEMLAAREMPANRLTYLRMLQEVSRPDLNFSALENLIKAEASVCYRLLRYLNSALFGLRNEIHSVRHALSIMGEQEARRWVRLVAAVGAGQEKTSDLVLSALVRGRFGESLSPRVQHGQSDLFLVGLLSLIDAMLEIPMEEILEKIPLDQTTKAVLLGKPSPLRPVFQLMLAHESGEWDAAASLCADLHLDAGDVAEYYWQAQQWARELS